MTWHEVELTLRAGAELGDEVLSRATYETGDPATFGRFLRDRAEKIDPTPAGPRPVLADGAAGRIRRLVDAVTRACTEAARLQQIVIERGAEIHKQACEAADARAAADDLRTSRRRAWQRVEELEAELREVRADAEIAWTALREPQSAELAVGHIPVPARAALDALDALERLGSLVDDVEDEAAYTAAWNAINDAVNRPTGNAPSAPLRATESAGTPMPGGPGDPPAASGGSEAVLAVVEAARKWRATRPSEVTGLTLVARTLAEAVDALAGTDGPPAAAEPSPWRRGVRWAAAEADAQAAGREPVYILDVTDHLRACANDPDRKTAVHRSRAPERAAADGETDA